MTTDWTRKAFRRPSGVADIFLITISAIFGQLWLGKYWLCQMASYLGQTFQVYV